MKNTGIFVTIIVGLIICIAIVFSFADRSSRKTESENGLRNAIENTVENLSENKKDYTVANAEEYVADFMEQLLLELDSNSEVTVEVLEADYEKNLLSIEVTETFTYINGKTGSVTCKKTIIMDQPVADESSMYTFTFYLTDQAGEQVVFKEYKADAGMELDLSYVTSPEQEGKEFDTWVDTSGQEVDLSQLLADQDYNFFARWK